MNVEANRIEAALGRLDPEDDDHWTTDGQPRVSAVCSLVGSEVVRAEIVDAAPEFNRAAAAAVRASIAAAAAGGGARDDDDEEGDDDGESVLAMPIEVVARSPELLRRVVLEVDAETRELLRRREGINARLAELAHKSQLASRMLDRLPRSSPSDRFQESIRGYLRRSAQAREARAERARRFVEAGVTPGDVAAQLGLGAAGASRSAVRTPGVHPEHAMMPRSLGGGARMPSPGQAAKARKG